MVSTVKKELKIDAVSGYILSSGYLLGYFVNQLLFFLYASGVLPFLYESNETINSQYYLTLLVKAIPPISIGIILFFIGAFLGKFLSKYDWFRPTTFAIAFVLFFQTAYPWTDSPNLLELIFNPSIFLYYIFFAVLLFYYLIIKDGEDKHWLQWGIASAILITPFVLWSIIKLDFTSSINEGVAVYHIVNTIYGGVVYISSFFIIGSLFGKIYGENNYSGKIISFAAFITLLFLYLLIVVHDANVPENLRYKYPNPGSQIIPVYSIYINLAFLIVPFIVFAFFLNWGFGKASFLASVIFFVFFLINLVILSIAKVRCGEDCSFTVLPVILVASLLGVVGLINLIVKKCLSKK